MWHRVCKYRLCERLSSGQNIVASQSCEHRCVIYSDCPHFWKLFLYCVYFLYRCQLWYFVFYDVQRKMIDTLYLVCLRTRLGQYTHIFLFVSMLALKRCVTVGHTMVVLNAPCSPLTVTCFFIMYIWPFTPTDFSLNVHAYNFTACVCTVTSLLALCERAGQYFNSMFVYVSGFDFGTKA